MKVRFETFGCRLNRAEALEMEAAFLARGWTLAERHLDADLIVVRGCSVTARAQAECARLVEHIRSKYPMKRVVVTGCVKDRRNEHWLRDLDAASAPVPRRTARAYLKVQDGCNSKCAFCIVPSFRGASASVAFDDALAKARRFLDAGYREIVVTGCNLAQYNSGGRRIADLVAALADLGGGSGEGAAPAAHRVRIGSVEPGHAATDLVDAMAERSNVCRFLHVAVQSGSNRVLTAMRRPYLVKDVDALVRKAASAMPGIGIGCDLMAGFPDETGNDHAATLALLQRLPFSNAHVFPFSERPGTLAASLPGAVPRMIRSARAHELADAARAKRNAYALRFKGREVEIVVEDERTLSGWTSEYLWCRAAGRDATAPTRRFAPSSEGAARRKSILRVRVKAVDGDALAGEPL